MSEGIKFNPDPEDFGKNNIGCPLQFVWTNNETNNKFYRCSSYMRLDDCCEEYCPYLKYLPTFKHHKIGIRVKELSRMRIIPIDDKEFSKINDEQSIKLEGYFGSE